MFVCVCVCLCLCVCVCVCVYMYVAVGWGVVKNICILYASQVVVTQSLTYQRSMGNLVSGGWNSVLSFEAQ